MQMMDLEVGEPESRDQSRRDPRSRLNVAHPRAADRLLLPAVTDKSPSSFSLALTAIVLFRRCGSRCDL